MNSNVPQQFTNISSQYHNFQNVQPGQTQSQNPGALYNQNQFMNNNGQIGNQPGRPPVNFMPPYNPGYIG